MIEGYISDSGAPVLEIRVKGRRDEIIVEGILAPALTVTCWPDLDSIINQEEAMENQWLRKEGHDVVTAKGQVDIGRPSFADSPTKPYDMKDKGAEVKLT